MNTEKKFWLLIAAFACLFALGVYSVFRPDKGPIQLIRGPVREIAPGLIAGPYPSRDEVAGLKEKGVQEIISLMDPSMPLEAQIIDVERDAAGKNGIEYLNFPLSFLNLRSDANMERINAAVAHALSSKGKRIYVHCYLGRHRVGVFEEEYRKAEKGGG
ncbi:MAG: hypothetical protein HY893_03420 [Deltaproteobacteria bacterium]|nr:hypothetical protein [Deltaproteobacteria bacterium]